MFFGSYMALEPHGISCIGPYPKSGLVQSASVFITALCSLGVAEKTCLLNHHIYNWLVGKGRPAPTDCIFCCILFLLNRLRNCFFGKDGCNLCHWISWVVHLLFIL